MLVFFYLLVEERMLLFGAVLMIDLKLAVHVSTRLVANGDVLLVGCVIIFGLFGGGCAI